MFIQILLILALIVVTGIRLWITAPRQIEGFVSAPAAQIADDVEDDPLDLPWIASWSAADRLARYGQQCHVLYTEAGPCDTTVQTVSPSCEAGMPHTRAGDRIVLPSSISLADRDPIIHHELVHILQTRHADSWLQFYRRNWGFKFVPQPPQGLPADVAAARRSNPDTWNPRSGGPWVCWQNRWWPFAVYRDAANPRLREADTVWWDAAAGTVLRDPPADWTAFFGHPSQDEHPHELAAVILAAGDTSTEAGRRLMNWWRAEGRRSQVDGDSVCPL